MNLRRYCYKNALFILYRKQVLVFCSSKTQYTISGQNYKSIYYEYKRSYLPILHLKINFQFFDKCLSNAVPMSCEHYTSAHF